MSVVGIDFGNSNCYISVARSGGIESIANDYSMRETPSFVAFGERQRILGVAAKSQHLTNLKKTFFGFKPLIGRKYRDPIVQKELSRLPFKISEDPTNGDVKIHVDYMGKERSFTPKQITAMLLTKLKETAEVALTTKVKDVVISVPCYYTDAERRCLLDAASMADLNVLKLMNDTTATALAYGIYKQDLPSAEEKARNVVFVDVGHRGVQAAACSFHKGKLTMVCCTYDNSVGGRNFNEIIARYFAEGFKTTYKIDVYSNQKAILKLITEIEKIKKQMSANTNKLPLNIECFMDDKDVKGFIDRATFEELAATEFAKVEKVLENCLAASKWKKEDIYSVEIVGGSTRVPAIKSAIEHIFGKVPNTTLNADEAVSRGCALQCAILSPTFKVREFSVTDVQPYSIKLKWQSDLENGDMGDMEVFPVFHQIPFSKMLSFFRRNNFTLTAEYSDGPNTEIIGIDKHIGNFEVAEVKPQADGSTQKVKVKVRLNLNGIFTVASASLVEKVEVEEEVPMEVEETKTEEKKDDAAAPDASAATDEKKEGDKPEANGEKSVPPEKKDGAEAPPVPPKTEIRKKVVTKNIDLPVSGQVRGSLAYDSLMDFVNIEKTMSNEDKLEAERLTCKNAVEEYVYDIRSKINDELNEYITPDDLSKYSLILEDSENWLYEDGENVEKQIYVDKLKELKLLGEPVKKRKFEYDTRSEGYNVLGHSIQMAQKAVDCYKGGDEKYNHIDEASMEKVAKLINEKTQWMNESINTLNNLPKTTNPPILMVQFHNEKKAFETIVNPIINKPKPKVEPPPPTDNKNEKGTEQKSAENPENKTENPPSTQEESGDKSASNDMDVD